MRALDLFSGMGGMTYALRGLGIVPVAYCERDPAAINVLNARMRAGDLPKAPIHTDVAKLKGAQLKHKPDIIIAGFPCVGLSCVGRREGFDHPATSLYDHILRLAAELKPRFLFLENVAAIRSSGGGLAHVASTLWRAGYTASWVSLKAYHVGAPHVRDRWFCLAVRRSTGTAPVTLTQKPGSFRPFSWAREPSPRLVPALNTAGRQRPSMLGNGVVPDCVRAAFLYLWTGSRNHLMENLRKVRWTLQMPSGGKPTKDMPAHGMLVGPSAKVAALPTPPGLLALPKSRAVTLDPNVYKWKGEHSPAHTSPRLQKPYRISTWATPRHGATTGSRVLTERATRDLATQLRFDVRTPAAQRAGYPNPNFLEWMMGLPRDWTKS
jgi:site-specific DNA-cytosine methylase